MKTIRQPFVRDVSRLSESRKKDLEKVEPFLPTAAKMACALAFGWIPAAIILFPFALLFLWLIRKTSGY